MNRRRVASGVGMMLSVVAALVLAACGSSSHTTSNKSSTAAKKAAQQAQADYQKCKSQLSSLLSAEENLSSHLDIGMNFTDYTQAVGNVKAAYDQTPIHQLDEKCLGVGVHTETALNDFAKAANTWNNCIGNINCNDSSIKPQLQANWSKASSEINQAKSALQNLQNPTSSGSGASLTTPTSTTPATTSPSTSIPAPSGPYAAAAKRAVMDGIRTQVAYQKLLNMSCHRTTGESYQCSFLFDNNDGKELKGQQPVTCTQAGRCSVNWGSYSASIIGPAQP